VNKTWWLLAALFLLSGCGGGGGGGSGTSLLTTSNSAIAAGPNVLAVVVDTGPDNGAYANINLPFVTVTICRTGTTSCQTIDHVLLDTGSYGLRIMAEKLSLTLDRTTAADGNALAECMPFLSGYSWGSVRLADVTLGGETASAVPIQVIGDTGTEYSVPPASCATMSLSSTAIDSVSALGANGVLGVGPLTHDCGDYCASYGYNYYSCTTSGSCGAVTAELSRQVANPVAMMPGDNNGVVVYLPTIPGSGAKTATGALALGIGTQSNNVPSGVKVFDVNGSGDLRTVYDGTARTAFFDTGSNGLFFASAINQCSSYSGFYCPGSTLALSAVMSGYTNGASESVYFNVADLGTLFTTSPGYTAFNDVGGYLSGYFDWGLPFFYGRKVFIAIKGQNTLLGTGPYVAF
jgi:hypothetical protein